MYPPQIEGSIRPRKNVIARWRTYTLTEWTPSLALGCGGDIAFIARDERAIAKNRAIRHEERVAESYGKKTFSERETRSPGDIDDPWERGYVRAVDFVLF